MEPAGNQMLQPFHVRNLQSALNDTVVRITAPGYDETISTNPGARLKYDDDDGDLVTVGSSLELDQHLDEKPSLTERRQLAQLQNSSQPFTDQNSIHVFSIDSRDDVQKVWQKIQISSETKSIQPENKETSDGEVPQKAVDSSTHTAKFEDYRVHHFNTTNAPQLRSPEHFHDDLKEEAFKVEVASAQDAPPANLTPEGKRQAQLAGEKFRARGLYSRARKMSAGPADRPSYHNRWAFYKTNEIPKGLPPRDSIRSSRFSKPDLVFEGNRQAQNAGDRLRSRTSRVRHTYKVPSERCNSNEDSWDSRLVAEPSVPAKHEEVTSRASLLEVFESELAKNKDTSSRTDTPMVSFHRPPAPLKSTLLDPVAGVVNADRPASPPTASVTIEEGINTAVSGFEMCLRGIVDTMKAAQPSNTDKQVLEETMVAFQNLAGNIALSGQGSEVQTLPQNGAIAQNDVRLSQGQDVKEQPPMAQDDANTKDEPRHVTKRDSQYPIMTAYRPVICTIQDAPARRSTHNPSSMLAKSSAQRAPEASSSKELRFADAKPEFLSDFSGPFQYHKPGPIHLPPHAPRTLPSVSARVGGERSLTSGCVDNLRRFNSVDTLRKPRAPRWQHESDPLIQVCRDRSASPATVTTRFPTIGQFENETFSAKAALPPKAAQTLIDLDPELGLERSQLVQDTSDSNGSVDSNVERTETSGQFFDRMTRMKHSRDRLNATKSDGESAFAPDQVRLQLRDDQSFNSTLGMNDGSAASKARLLRPFDAFESELTTRQKDNSVNRSATVAAPSYKPLPTLRRPYSEVFSGTGRVPWESFARKDASDAQTSSASLPLPAQSTVPLRPLTWHKPSDTSIRRSSTDASTRRTPEGRSHHENYQTTALRPRDINVRKCVDSLLRLGFEMERSRLRVYASAADGNLDEALDMLTEDQKVHDSRR